MPELDFDAQAAALRQLLGADAVLYWAREGANLALPLGVSPAGLMSDGFLPPTPESGCRLLRGQPAASLLPLRLRARLDRDAGAVLCGHAGEQGGILAAWFRPADLVLPRLESVMDFALAAMAGHVQLVLAHHECRHSEVRRMSGMADALPQGVVLVPAGNRPGYVNRMAAQLLRLPHGEAEAGLLADGLAALARRASNHDSVLAQVEAFVGGGGDSFLSGRVWRFDGEPSALRVTVAPIDPGHASGWLWLIEDVSAAEAEAAANERRRYLETLNAELEAGVQARTAQLERANQALRDANQELEHFAYAMAHDLQNPLRSIVGFARMVQQAVRRYDDAQIDDWSDKVIESSRRLQDLIQGLLSYTRLDAQDLPIRPVDMNALFDEVAASLQSLTAETDAEIVRGDLPIVPGVRIQLGQLLQNLFENAIKYRSEAPPRIAVSCARLEGEWRFAVTDNGMGIDPQYREQIFGVFKRLHAYSKIPGTGIGLALCRRIVERHGGKIWVESQPGVGSTFLFTLPAERAEALQA